MLWIQTPRPTRFLLSIPGALALAFALNGDTMRAQTERSIPTTPARLAQMQHHFLQVTLIHEAMIRGDLPAVRAPARELARLPAPPDTPVRTAPFVAAIAAAAARAAEAPDLETAASATSMMLRQCGDCHRSAGIFPAPSAVARPDVGGLVGHMLEHQRAADDLLQGLLIPSGSLWQRGAGRLKAAPLRPGDLPVDRAFTAELKRTDARVHALAAAAAAATDAPARASVYADLLTTCAQCHGLHRQIWGPRTK